VIGVLLSFTFFRQRGLSPPVSLTVPIRCLPPIHSSSISNMPFNAVAIGSLVGANTRLDVQVVDCLKSKGEGYLTRINDILTNLMEAEGGTRRGQ
jgi:hypothetical protein